MAKDFGHVYAKKWGDAHEQNSKGLDKQMDLFNNEQGRKIVNNVSGNMRSSFWQPRLEAEIIKNIDAGNLRRIVNNRLVKTDYSGKR